MCLTVLNEREGERERERERERESGIEREGVTKGRRKVSSLKKNDQLRNRLTKRQLEKSI